MLRSLRDLEGDTVHASDGDVGKVVDFLIDDEQWAVRYLVVDTGGFFDRHRVLISPISFREADWSSHRFQLTLTADQVENSPSIDTDAPVSRQHERHFLRYYDYPYYWGYAGVWGMGSYPGSLAGARRSHDVAFEDSDESSDTHLRSIKEVTGYHIEGTDGAIGHVEDFVADDRSWELRYLVVDTSNWWFGKKVLVAPHWASRISWEEEKVFVDESRQAIKDSPEWDPKAPVNREYEALLYDYYGRPVYWEGGDRRRASAPHHQVSQPR